MFYDCTKLSWYCKYVDMYIFATYVCICYGSNKHKFNCGTAAYLKREIPWLGDAIRARTHFLHIPRDAAIESRVHQQHDEDVNKFEVIIHRYMTEHVFPRNSDSCKDTIHRGTA